MSFYIIPPRKVVIGDSGATVVTSLNNLSGDLTLVASGDLQLTISGGNTFTYGVIPGTFVRRSGDTMTGNLAFQSGLDLMGHQVYGLRLLDLSADPTYGDRGGVYYNWLSNVLKLYDGTTWQTLAQLGALTPTSADLIYLRLDGTNGPMQGDLDMGATHRFALGGFSTNPMTGVAGQLIYNTTTNAVQVYNGTMWAAVGSGGGVSSIGAGTGLVVDSGGANPITATGVLDVDETYPFTWTGNHTFASGAVINFSSAQQLPLIQLYDSFQAIGDVVIRTASGWQRYGVGSVGEVLTVTSVGGNSIPQWSVPFGGTIGTPTDAGTSGNPVTGYEDGFFPFTSATTIADAVDRLNELLELLAPQQGNLLSTAPLTVTGSAGSTAKVSANIPGAAGTAWYQNGASAGSTITGYIAATNVTWIFNTPNSSNTFRCGSANTASTYGTLYHNLYTNGSVNQLSYAMTAGLGSAGSSPRVLTLAALTAYPTAQPVWEIGQANVNYTHSTEGYVGHEIQHTLALTSPKLNYYLDTISGASPSPAFSGTPAYTDATPVYKYLSGIQYYYRLTTFNASFAAAVGIFNRCYHATNVSRLLCPSMTPQVVNPGSTPNYNDIFDRTIASSASVLLTLDLINAASTPSTQFITITIYKASGISASANVALTLGICTWNQPSTIVSDVFFDEYYRTVIAGTAGSWVSSTSLSNGNAQVRNGVLQYPDAAEYPGFSGSQEYQRIITIASRSTGTILFSNAYDGIGNTFNVANISPYGTGDLNILIYLDNDAKWFDLGVSAGTSPGTRLGNTRALAYGGQDVGTAGSTMKFSLGTFNTQTSGVGNQGKFRLVIIFNNNTQTLTSLTVS